MSGKKGLKIGILVLSVLLALLLVAGWMLPGLYRQRASDFFRQRFALYSDQKLQAFTTQISLFEHFPNVTFTFQNIAVQDTSGSVPVEVLRIGHAKVTVNIRDLNQEKIPIRQLFLQGVRFYQQVDSAGVRRHFHFRARDTVSAPTDLLVAFPHISISEAHILTDNAWKRTGFSLHIAHADLSGSLTNDTLKLIGKLQGKTGYLKSKTKLRFQQQPFTVSARYTYIGSQQKGTVDWSQILLQSDTLSLTGTHTRLPDASGSALNMELQGRIQLSELVQELVPPKLKPYLTQTTSLSKVQLRYTLTGISGPMKRPKTHLWFSLHDGELAWKGTQTRLTHLFLNGELDNGPQQNPRSSVLHIHSFRCHSDLDSLQGTAQVSNFENPFIRVRLGGKLNVQTIATIAHLPHSSDYQGLLRGQVAVEGFAGSPVNAYFANKLQWKGGLYLQGGSFVHPAIAARFTNLDARMEFGNHWVRVANLQGKLGGHAFQGQATIQHLLGYLFRYTPDIQVDARLKADHLEAQWVSNSSRQTPETAHSADTSTRRSPSVAIIPDFVRLHFQVQCTRLLIDHNDTLRAIHAYLQSSSNLLHLSPVSFQMHGALVSGSMHIPNTWQHPGKTRMQLTMQLPELNLRHTIQAVSDARKSVRHTPRPLSPTLTEKIHALVQESEAHVTVRIGTIQLPGDEKLQRFFMQIDKKGTHVRVPDLRFTTSAGGTATGTGTFGLRSTPHSTPQVIDPRLNLMVNYSFLNLQYFMQQVAAMGDLLPSPSTTPHSIHTPGRMHLLAAADTYHVALHVRADKIHYQTLDGRGLWLQTHIQQGKARIDDFGMHAFGGQLALQGNLEWGRRGQKEGIPVELRLQLQDIHLPHLFRIADQLNLDVIRSHNIEGKVTCNLAVHTELDHTFTPHLSQTMLYCKALIQNMELIDVQPLQHALRFLRKKRTEHVYFKDVHAHFLFLENRFLTPGVQLDNNICGLTLSGAYTMNGPADMYMDLNVFEILFGNNKRRIEQIQLDADTVQAVRNQHVLVYRLPDDYRQNAYKVKVCTKKERSQIDLALAAEFYAQLRAQKIDTVFTPLSQTRQTP